MSDSKGVFEEWVNDVIEASKYEGLHDYQEIDTWPRYLQNLTIGDVLAWYASCQAPDASGEVTSETTFAITESGEIDDSQFSSIDYVTIGDISTENAKAEVEKWPPDVIRVDFSGEIYYYNLADCHNQAVEEEASK